MAKSRATFCCSGRYKILETIVVRILGWLACVEIFGIFRILPVNLWDFRHFLFGNWDFIAISSEIRLSVIRPFNKDEFVMMETMADELTTLFKAEKLRELCCLSKVLDNCKSGIALRASSTAIPAGWASFPKGKACPWRKLPGHKIAPKAHKISTSFICPKAGKALTWSFLP